ncbi:polysaccharide deacetylase family protein [Paenactinomyces guangxiensis]|uniref:Polysaccharide deacetylase family protein n=1 Tax=Paenactinomyces guangxiensis TaxID=1490290 RepID=A0A7W1WTM3_9BACL|nr:polysaccharide deacetylase family protein [Paenactinomyces guangxiensis]MBA4495762.1 polysaccharide deacetylase family protein [Paenactinomyces guangxiensis]MBH8592751.1 polysaccharide deacetylase family protein [Paenactinomyces guangxiensis]
MNIMRKVGAFLMLFFLVLIGCTDVKADEKVSRLSEKPSTKPSQRPDQVKAKKQEQAKASRQKQIQEKNKIEQQPEKKLPTAPLTQEEKKELEKYKDQVLFYKGPTTRKRVALTFDDGPDKYYTPQILDILKRERIRATFFVVGNLAQKNPDVLRRIDQEGHVIGNHSWSHPQFTKISKRGVESQLSKTNKAIRDATGKEPLLIRPPYGSINKRLEKQIGGKGYKIINWSVDTLDWKGRSSDRILLTVKKQVKPGGIILQHSSGAKGRLNGTVEALPQVITYLKKNGYEFVTVDELLHTPAYANSSR